MKRPLWDQRGSAFSVLDLDLGDRLKAARVSGRSEGSRTFRASDTAGSRGAGEVYALREARPHARRALRPAGCEQPGGDPGSWLRDAPHGVCPLQELRVLYGYPPESVCANWQRQGPQALPLLPNLMSLLNKPGADSSFAIKIV